MPRLRYEEDTTLLSFLDTLSNGVGAAILLLLVFGSSAIAVGRGLAAPDPNRVHVFLRTEDADGIVQLRAERTHSTQAVAFVQLHHLSRGRVLAGARHDAPSGLTLYSRPERVGGKALLSTGIFATLPRGQCLGLSFGYQDRRKFEALGRLEPLRVEVEWKDTRCCLDATPDFSGEALWLTASAHGTERCPSAPRVDCRCGK